MRLRENCKSNEKGLLRVAVVGVVDDGEWADDDVGDDEAVAGADGVDVCRDPLVGVVQGTLAWKKSKPE